ncbi:hypothetical protein WN48_08883 [Eufriesea mexicana]|uniref:Uncharacterized protein n=1 Tax=Eufriesea mexicana TaxID=516756 RepID=A0A310SGP7_9HYME|nr:hypothetical protein WN48_08883 [Eufriesea mexicana]
MLAQPGPPAPPLGSSSLLRPRREGFQGSPTVSNSNELHEALEPGPTRGKVSLWWMDEETTGDAHRAHRVPSAFKFAFPFACSESAAQTLHASSAMSERRGVGGVGGVGGAEAERGGSEQRARGRRPPLPLAA